MTMEQMRTFLAVADCLNFTKAAERLYLSQPTVSRQIQSLEEDTTSGSDTKRGAPDTSRGYYGQPFKKIIGRN